MAKESNNDSKNNKDVIEELKKELQDIFDETKKSREEFDKMEQELEEDFIKRLKLAEQIPNPKNGETFRRLCHLHKWLMYNNIHMYGADETNKIWWCQLAEIPFMADKKKGKEETPEYEEMKNFIQERQTQWLYDFFEKWLPGNDARREYEKLPDRHK